jgi:alkyl hydroperoxide reductase subunit AhpC
VIQLGELEKRMNELTALAKVYVVNVDIPDNSRWLKELDKITVPVLLDNDNLRVSRLYDMHSQPGRPMGGMTDVPTMGFVVIDGEGVIRKMRANIYFGRDADYLIRVLKTL